MSSTKHNIEEPSSRWKVSSKSKPSSRSIRNLFLCCRSKSDEISSIRETVYQLQSELAERENTISEQNFQIKQVTQQINLLEITIHQKDEYYNAMQADKDNLQEKFNTLQDQYHCLEGESQELTQFKVSLEQQNRCLAQTVDQLQQKIISDSELNDKNVYEINAMYTEKIGLLSVEIERLTKELSNRNFIINQNQV